MPTSNAGAKSSRNPGRKPGAHQPNFTGGQIDMLEGVDTGYPDLRHPRPLPGNGPIPRNSWGKTLKHPNVGRGKQ